MRVPSCLVALLLISPAVHAETWFVLDTPGGPGDLGIEADMDSLRQAGGRREVRVRVSYAQTRQYRSGEPFRSVVTRVEFECEGQLAGYRDATFYSETGGGGMVTAREEGRLAAAAEGTRDLLPPRSVEVLIRAACSRPTPAVP
jgi:hypothetical protein